MAIGNLKINYKRPKIKPRPIHILKTTKTAMNSD
jgi:hypothetical protein